MTVLEQESEKHKYEWPSAGLLSPAQAVPMQSPESWLAVRDRMVTLNLYSPKVHGFTFVLRPELMRWGWATRKFCTPEAFTKSTKRLTELATRSVQLTAQICEELKAGAAIDPKTVGRGLLRVYEHETPFGNARVIVLYRFCF